jgi:hypothetical protein
MNALKRTWIEEAVAVWSYVLCRQFSAEIYTKEKLQKILRIACVVVGIRTDQLQNTSLER